jgi:hypothetical protein
MPVGDWQFWVVTVLALIAAWLVVRLFIPKRRAKRGRRTRLTIEGRKR